MAYHRPWRLQQDISAMKLWIRSGLKWQQQLQQLPAIVNQLWRIIKIFVKFHFLFYFSTSLPSHWLKVCANKLTITLCWHNSNLMRMIVRLFRNTKYLHCFRQELLLSLPDWEHWEDDGFMLFGSWSWSSPLSVSSSLKFRRLETRSGSGLIIFLPNCGDSPISQSPSLHLLLSTLVSTKIISQFISDTTHARSG